MRWLTRHPTVTVTWALVLTVISSVGLVLNLIAPLRDHGDFYRPGQVLFLLGSPVLAVVGAYLVHHRPSNPLGHLAVLAATGMGVDTPFKAVLSLQVGSADGALRRIAALVDNTTWSLTYLAIVLLLQVYPTGRVLGPRWRWLLRATFISGTVLFTGCLLAGKADEGVQPAIRLGAPSAAQDVGFAVAFGAMVACLLTAIASLFVRWRRSRRSGDVVASTQIRWLSWAAVVAVVLTASQAPVNRLAGPELPWLGNFLSELGPYALTVALVVAVTRHGLFEIDRIVSRTVAYVVVTGLLVGVYLGLVAGLSALLPTSFNSLGVAVSTLAVAALFVPVRRRVQSRVDRRFNRARSNRRVLVERFADTLRRDPTHGSDGLDLVVAVREAVEPRHVSVWMVSAS